MHFVVSPEDACSSLRGVVRAPAPAPARDVEAESTPVGDDTDDDDASDGGLRRAERSPVKQSVPNQASLAMDMRVSERVRCADQDNPRRSLHGGHLA